MAEKNNAQNTSSTNDTSGAKDEADCTLEMKETTQVAQEEEKQKDKQKMKDILEALLGVFPAPKSELVWENNFELLICVILSAQATDKSVNATSKSLFDFAPTALAMSQKTQAEIEKIIHSIGLYHNKAKNIIATSKMLVDEYEGRVPCTMEELLRLPGVGRKTANVVLNVAFQKPTMPVDTHIARVSNRLGFCNTKDPFKIEQALLPLLPKIYAKDAHHLLLLQGRYVCTAKKPKCFCCAVKKYCKTYRTSKMDKKTE